MTNKNFFVWCVVVQGVNEEHVGTIYIKTSSKEGKGVAEQKSYLKEFKVKLASGEEVKKKVDKVLGCKVVMSCKYD